MNNCSTDPHSQARGRETGCSRGLVRTISMVGGGLAVLALGGQASANVFMFPFYDAKAVGRGNASAATDSDPSAIAYNVGGLAAGQGTSVTLGGSLVFPNVSYTDTAGSKTDTESSHPVVPHLFVSSHVTDMIAVGIGFHAPFGLAITWPDSAPTTDVAKYQSLRTYFITPSVGVDLGKYVPGLTAGAGLDLVPASLETTQYIFIGDTRGQSHITADAFAIGGRIGAMYRPEALPQLSVGAMWRSQVKEDFTGKAEFVIADPYRGLLPPDGDMSTSLKIPQSVSVGAAFRPIPELELEADAMWVNWAKLKSMTIHLPAMIEATSPFNASNTITLSAGAEYKLPQYSAAVRLGYVYDPAGIPDTTLGAGMPDTAHHELTAGASYSLDSYDLHFSMLYAIPQDRATSDTPDMPVHKGTYALQVLITSLTLEGHFGR